MRSTGFGFVDKDLSFSLPEREAGRKLRSSEMPLCITNIKLFLARFIAFVVIRDLVRRESNVCV